MTTFGKVFLSHASEDKPFVERLAADLAKHSIPVWLDKFNLKIGESVSGKINDGIANSRYFAIVLSPAAVRSKWVTEELNAALMKQVANDGTFLLPILLEDCEIPPLLAHRKHADFRSGYDAALDELLSIWDRDAAACKAVNRESVFPWPDVEMPDDEFVYLHSERFDKFFRMNCSLSWSVQKTIRYLTDTLALPWSHEIPNVGMKWSFSYGIRHNGKRLNLGETLADAGITHGDVIQISINGTYQDLYEKELTKMWSGDKIYMIIKKDSERIEWLKAKVAERKRMTSADLSKSANSCFDHLNTDS